MGKTSSLAMLALKWVNAKGKLIHIIHVDPKDKPMVRSQIYNRLKAHSHGATAFLYITWNGLYGCP